MAPAPLAVLLQCDAVRVVALGLVGLVVPALALLAREGDGDPDVSAGHSGTPKGLRCGSSPVRRALGKGKPRTGARSRARIAPCARRVAGHHADTKGQST